MDKKSFDILRKRFGTHKAAAKWLGISYTRYNEWRWKPDDMPEYSRRLIELAVILKSKLSG